MKRIMISLLLIAMVFLSGFGCVSFAKKVMNSSLERHTDNEGHPQGITLEKWFAQDEEAPSASRALFAFGQRLQFGASYRYIATVSSDGDSFSLTLCSEVKKGEFRCDRQGLGPTTEEVLKQVFSEQKRGGE